MPDAFRKISPGASVTQFSITAYNRMLDMLNWWQTQQQFTGASLIRGVQQNSIFEIQNDSGADQPWLGVLGIDGPLYLPADDEDGFSAKPVLRGVIPDKATHRGKWAVLLSPVGNGDMCRCCVSGMVPAQVYVNSVDDEFCDIVDQQTGYLGTGSSGAGQILWIDPDAEESEIAWAIIRIGTTTKEKIKVKLTSNLDAEGSATAQPQKLDLSQKKWVDDTNQAVVTVYDMRGSFCGITGEIIEVEVAGTDDDGDTIYEVTSGGATWHVASLNGNLAAGGSQTANVGPATVTVYSKYLSSGSITAGIGRPIGISYDFVDKKWYATEAVC